MTETTKVTIESLIKGEVDQEDLQYIVDAAERAAIEVSMTTREEAGHQFTHGWTEGTVGGEERSLVDDEVVLSPERWDHVIHVLEDHIDQLSGMEGVEPPVEVEEEIAPLEETYQHILAQVTDDD